MPLGTCLYDRRQLLVPSTIVMLGRVVLCRVEATGCSPSLYYYNNTAPVALTYAAVSTTKLCDRSGKRNTGGLYKSYSSQSNATS